MRIGVDEAGKGPVLGSMFAAAVRTDPDALPAAVDDSKHLARERREALAASIRERADAVSVVEIPVERIDDPGTDMNGLTVAAHAEALEGVVRRDDRAYLDACDTNAVRFERRVRSRLAAAAVDAETEESVQIRAEHGADETYPIVSAASIVAKVERDAHVDRLAEAYGDVGSGYPGDGTTRAFLDGFVREHGRLPGCARRSWQTSRDALAARGQSSLSEF